MLVENQKSSKTRILKLLLCTLIAGLVSIVTVPLYSFARDYLYGYDTFASLPLYYFELGFYACLISMPICIIVGTPILIALEKAGIRSPALVGFIALALTILAIGILEPDYRLWTSMLLQENITWLLLFHAAISGITAGVLHKIMFKAHKQK